MIDKPVKDLYSMITTMILLYIECGWEKDHLIKYVLQDVRFTNYFVIAREHLTESFVNKLSNTSSDFVLVFSSNNVNFTTAEWLVRTLNPKLIIHNSDEHGNRIEFFKLSTYVPLILMQYAFHYNLPPNMMHLPVAYLPGVHAGGVPDWDSIKPTNERKYDWAFVGSLKSDRAYAIRTFKERWTDATFFEGKATQVELGDTYKNTRFVISPRGNANLMCSRTFEAITCGAIPVIANCSKEEVERTYNFGDRPIPFMYARTWEDAVDLCRSIQNLDEIQQRCIDWYRSIHESIRTEIQDVFY